MRDLITAKVLINGVPSESELVPVTNPANFHEIVGYVARGTIQDVERAVQSAEHAAYEWANLSTAQRGEAIAAAYDDWNYTYTDRAVLLTKEQGKVLWESLADCRGPITISDYFLATASDVLKTEITEDARGTIVRRHMPFGVTAVIAPWNTPVYLAFQHVIPALISGNTVVVKPPEQAPLALWWSLQILAAKLPAGVLNIVPGSGSVVGAALAEHPKVRKVLFTGSYAVGQGVLAASAPQIKSVGLELGGNDPAIVLDDFEMSDENLHEIALGVFTLTGQICFNIKRIYVEMSRYQEFVTRFCEIVNRIKVGDGLNKASTIGPVNNAKEHSRLEALVENVRSSGATVQQLGGYVKGTNIDNGYFLLPHVVTNIDPTHQLVTDEQFGPIIPILPFEDIDAVINEVNQSEFGLCASVWSQNINRALQLGSRIHAGTVFVNVHRIGASDMTMPFGGTKQSGLGRTHGPEILLECTEPHVVVHRVDLQKFPGPELASIFFTNQRTQEATATGSSSVRNDDKGMNV